MADIDTYKLRDEEVKIPTPGNTTWMDWSISAATDIGNDGDFITLADLPKGVIIVDGYVHHSATIGTGCVLALYSGATALTADTSAGGASTVRMATTAPPQTLTTETELRIEIEGADTNAAATIKAGVLLALDPSYGHIT